MNNVSTGRFRAFPAGCHSKKGFNRLRLRNGRLRVLLTEGLRAKPWNEYPTPGAPQMDSVFTVCDSAAGETCPSWPGQPVTAHWGIEDPGGVNGTDLNKARAFALAHRYLETRVSLFAALPIARLDDLSLRAKVREIGQAERASHPHPDVA